MKLLLVRESINESEDRFFDLVFQELLKLGFNDQEADFIIAEVSLDRIPDTSSNIENFEKIAKLFVKKVMNKLIK